MPQHGTPPSCLTACNISSLLTFVCLGLSAAQWNCTPIIFAAGGQPPGACFPNLFMALLKHEEVDVNAVDKVSILTCQASKFLVVVED